MQFASVYDMTGSSSAPRALKPGTTVCTHCCQSVRSRTPSRALDALEVRQQVGLAERLAAVPLEARRRVPLLVVLTVGAQRDLGVDRGRAADAAAAEQHHRWLVWPRRLGKRRRPPQLVVRPGLPAHVVGGGLVGPGLEQQHAATTVRELAGDHAPAGSRADHDRLVAFAAHVIPR